MPTRAIASLTERSKVRDSDVDPFLADRGEVLSGVVDYAFDAFSPQSTRSYESFGGEVLEMITFSAADRLRTNLDFVVDGDVRHLAESLVEADAEITIGRTSRPGISRQRPNSTHVLGVRLKGGPPVLWRSITLLSPQVALMPDETLNHPALGGAHSVKLVEVAFGTTIVKAEKGMGYVPSENVAGGIDKNDRSVRVGLEPNALAVHIAEISAIVAAASHKPAYVPEEEPTVDTAEA